MKPCVFLPFIAVLLMAAITACTPPLETPEPTIGAHTYTPSEASLLNPERGFFTPYELPSPAGFSTVRGIGNTLVHANIRLDEWRDSDLPQELLDGLHQNFSSMREGGVKAIIRFAYNQGPYPDSEPDASKGQILQHIEQLRPLLQQNADVIAWVEAGFIGAWGEWHTSTNGLDNLNDKREILFALLGALPSSRMVQVRYPTNIIEMFPNVLTSEQAFTGTNQARVAHHNDCFLSSEDDVGTYNRDGTNTIFTDQAYLAELTRFTPMSGETCAVNPPRSACPTTLNEMALLHFSAINQGYHKQVIRGWKNGGCLEEITNRLGYRLVLISALFNERVIPGGILHLTVNLVNEGFGSLINERQLFVLLDGAERYTMQVDDVDPRHWEGGQSSSFTVNLPIPANLPAGDYRLALWLPDNAETLQHDSRYAVQFANADVWDEAGGFNVLGNISIVK